MTLNVAQIVVAPMPGHDGARGVNGPELRALNSIALWDRRKVRPTIMYPSSGRLWSAFVDAGVDIVDFDVRSKYSFECVLRLRKIIESRQIDVVHSQGAPAVDLFAALAVMMKRGHRPRLVVTRPVMIEDLLISRTRQKIYQAIDHLTLRQADAIVAVSKDGRDRLRDLGVPVGKLQLVYNGVDLDRFARDQADRRADLGLPAGSLVLGACAQLTATKAWPDFLQVLSKVRERFPNVYGVIAGDGPMRADLERECDSLNLREFVRFTGFLHDVRPALRSLDVYLSMSKAEGLSVALTEAMACGLPAVVTDVGGSREQVISGVTGEIILPGDVHGAIEAVCRMVGNSDLRRRMGQSAKERAVELFDVKRMVAQYADVYQRVVGQASPTSV